MDFLSPILASAGFVIVIQLIINIADRSGTFRQWKIQRKASIEDELHGELKRQNNRLEADNSRLNQQIDEWQDRYYRLLVEYEKSRNNAAIKEKELNEELDKRDSS